MDLKRHDALRFLLVSFFVWFSLVFFSSPVVSKEKPFNFDEEVLTKFKDVPDAHWAQESIYEVSRLGIIHGYPDGTFRGSKTVSRYEVAKLAEAFVTYLREKKGGVGPEFKALQETFQTLKTELLEEQAKRQKAQETALEQFRGTYSSQLRSVNPLDSQTTRQGTRADYRLEMDDALGENATLHLDTMDTGFNGGTSSDLARTLVDVTTWGETAWGKWSVTAGPGDIVHPDDTFVPSESGRVYVRPSTGASFKQAFSLLGKPFSLTHRYQAVVTGGTDGVQVNQYTFQLGVPFRQAWLQSLQVGVVGDVYFKGLSGGGGRDLRGLLFAGGERDDWTGLFQFGFSNFKNQQGLMLLGLLAYDRKREKETHAEIRMAKIGSGYLDASLGETVEREGRQVVDFFDKPLTGGTIHTSFLVEQKVAERREAYGKGSFVTDGRFQYGKGTPASQWTVEAGYRFIMDSKRSWIELAYQAFQKPSLGDSPTSELLRFSLRQVF